MHKSSGPRKIRQICLTFQIPRFVTESEARPITTYHPIKNKAAEWQGFAVFSFKEKQHQKILFASIFLRSIWLPLGTTECKGGCTPTTTPEVLLPSAGPITGCSETFGFADGADTRLRADVCDGWQVEAVLSALRGVVMLTKQ